MNQSILDAPLQTDLDIWLSTELPAFQAEHHVDPLPTPDRALSLSDLLAGDARHLRETHANLSADKMTPQTAAVYLAGWFGGFTARVVGFALATAGAGLLPSARSVRWHVVPAGWPAWIGLDQPNVVVPLGHPWSGFHNVTTARSPGQVTKRAVLALVDLLRPLIDTCHGLAARVSKTALWNEVADGLGGALRTGSRTVSQPMIDALDAAVRTPDVPWRRRPRLGFASSTLLGTVHVAQKGGCCLAFTEDDSYCAGCRFRAPADSDACQVRLLEQRHQRRTNLRHQC